MGRKKRLDRANKASKGFVNGFKEFITRGNVVDLAVGVIVGGAFGKIVNSLVADIIMPPIGYLIGNVDFKDLVIVLVAATDELPAVTINYGNFIMTIIEFLIIAFSIYAVLTLVVRRREFMERIALEEQAELDALNPKEEEEIVEEVIPEDILLLREIRDSLKQQK